MKGKIMKEISVCTRYSEMGASSRLRFFMYRELLKQNGISADFHYMLGDSYLKRLYSNKSIKIHALAALAKRFLQLPFLKEDLLIEYELLPFISYQIENIILSRHNYILSFDDAVWEKYRGNASCEGKFERLAVNAKGIITANDQLFKNLEPYNKNIIKIPTAIDLAKYTTADEVKKYPVFTVVWIGTPVTYRDCLLPFSEMFKELSKLIDFELLIVAKKDLVPIDGVNMRFLDWNAADEASILKRAHVGIMPLQENDFMRGKSAYKLIQYLGAGLPCIASPVGENKVLLSHGGTGFAATTADEWLNALQQLKNNENMRLEMGRNAFALAKEYSIQKYAPVMADFIKDCFKAS